VLAVLIIGLGMAAEPTPKDHDAVYMVLVDRFANADASNDDDADSSDPRAFHGGDLAGIRQHLDHIQGLGFRTLWLSPITRMRTKPIGEHGAFHGYWVADGSTLEPRFGTPADLDGLTADLAARDMRLVLDVVTNHVAPDSALTRDHPDWFHQEGDITDWSDPDERVTHDVHGLPDLAQENPAVRAHLIAEGQRWIEQATPAGFRLDAVRHVPEDFVRAYIDAMQQRAGPDFVLMGEVFDGNPVAVADAARATGLTHTFDFPLHYALIEAICGDGDLRKPASVLSADRDYPADHTHLTFVDNHDTARIRTACGDDEDRVVDILRLLLALRGTPVITYGTEAELTGKDETAARRDMVFGPDNRTHNAIGQGLALRATHPALRNGRTHILAATEEHLSLLRWLADGAVLIEIGKPTEGESTVAESLYAENHRVWVGSVSTSALPGLIGPAQAAVTAPPVSLTLAPDATLGDQPIWVVGSRQSLGGWSPAHAVGPIAPGETLTVQLDAASMIVVKPIRRHPDGAVEWLSQTDRYIWIPADASGPLRVSVSRSETEK